MSEKIIYVGRLQGKNGRADKWEGKKISFKMEGLGFRKLMRIVRDGGLQRALKGLDGSDREGSKVPEKELV